MEPSSEPQVQIRLVAKQQKYAVPDAPIVVPQQLQRYGLSDIVNHLLNNEKPIPFDFLIDGEFLRVSVANYLKEKNLSAENILTLEYVESMLPPTEIASFSQDDWISSVAAASVDRFVVGSYDGIVRVWNAQSECEDELRGHQSAVKCVAVAGDLSKKGKIEMISGSQDQTAIAWGSKNGQRRALYAARGHTGNIEAVAINPTNTHFVTASTDSTIRFWSLAVPKHSEDGQVALTEQEPAAKKRKGTNVDIMTKAAIGTLSGHVGAVTSICFNKDQESQVFSGGWDHSVRTWDVASGVNVATSLCDKVVLDVAYSEHSRLAATGHADHAIRLWDPRSQESTVVKLRLSSHKGFVSSVAWGPNSAYMLASASHDSTVKVWDIRSRTPLYTVQATNDKDKGKKLLALDWHESLLLAGGESGSLRIHSIGSRNESVAGIHE
ncbi:ribosome biogenesis protein ytm1 [Coemansia spiralis]|uniref:Ribosome biogenesis protein YTM1 n=2 Tax=Coemansia TaxID=4863 RepID=A0A9W8GD12_9FUNG|nr:WD40-repeat-containing domain protein [Coemansia spiralis]KAJ1993782.1 ribosome biogenesis protein ytm1 [Coemansia umbellata]KAJ2623158.1 ribosome biogenesis protein ytm1 [Coemansia sp. RSA 1358]KAJ2680036.1 ribosome biogenesis protein ytm1 [Coemansia spiralis]